MVKNLRQHADETRAGLQRRIYSDRLLATLVSICRHLRRRQSRLLVREAYREVEQSLAWLLSRSRKRPLARLAGRREP